MANRTLRIGALAAALCLAGGGCTSTSTSAGPSTGPNTTLDALEPSDPSAPAAPDLPAPTDAASWCQAYGTLAQQLSGAAATPERATAGLAAIDPINQLMATGADLDFFTAEEAKANQRVFSAYRAVLSLAATGSTEDSEEMADAREKLSTVSAEERAMVASANSKLSDLCLTAQPTASPSPS